MGDYHFDTAGREQYTAVMKKAEYMEFPSFQPRLDSFCCYSCTYMRKASKSPTGFWCEEWKFPDRPHGCCNEYKPVAGLIDGKLSRTSNAQQD